MGCTVTKATSDSVRLQYLIGDFELLAKIQILCLFLFLFLPETLFVILRTRANITPPRSYCKSFPPNSCPLLYAAPIDEIVSNPPTKPFLIFHVFHIPLMLQSVSLETLLVLHTSRSNVWIGARGCCCLYSRRLLGLSRWCRISSTDKGKKKGQESSSARAFLTKLVNHGTGVILKPRGRGSPKSI